MLKTPGSLSIGAFRVIGNRTARAIVSRLVLSDAGDVPITGDPAPNPAEFVHAQSLWIDATSLLPVRWEVSQRQATIVAVDFEYVQLALSRPAGVNVPTCIP
jgi:hypothetical protein